MREKLLPFSIEKLEKIVTKVEEKKILKAYNKNYSDTKHSMKSFFNVFLWVYDSLINTLNDYEL